MLIGMSLDLTGRLLASVSPVALFAGGEVGVWYDPSDLNTLFQDNAGTTPVTTPGQTVGLMLDKSQNGVGTKGSACRNLLTYTEAFTNATWLTQGGSWSAVDANGFQTFTEDTATSQHRLYDDGFSVVSGQTYTLSAQVAYGTRRWVFLAFYDGATTVTAWFDLLNGVKGSVTAGVTSTMTTVSSGVYNITLTRTSGATSSAANVQIGPQSADGETVGWTGTGATTRIAKYQFEQSATATAYQMITSSWAATIAGNHATQATSAQRPTYGINPIVGTRNLLTYTEQFDNAAWTKTRSSASANAVVAPDGQTTADKITEDTTASSTHFVVTQFARTVAVGPTSFSVYLKAAERTRAQVSLSDNATGALLLDINLATGAFTSSRSGTWSGLVATVDSAGNGWYRCAVSGTQSSGFALPAVFIANDAGAVSYTGDGTSGLYVWGAQLEQSATATAYQKVVSQYEVTQAGVQSAGYLRFDGVDDGMVTNTITPAIDKVQVFAGVRKLSDAATAAIVELGTNSTTVAGSFGIQGPSVSGVNRFIFNSIGTLYSFATTTSTAFNAPITAVLAGLGDISGDSAILRANGATVATAATDQGTGNYLAYPLYIGRRGGASVPYNGRIYSLITRFGANLTDGQITATESWVNSKVGAY